jgi:hypothetical protein
MMPDRVEELRAIDRRKDGPKLGQDGVIPGKHQAAVCRAIEIAWTLGTNPAFVEIFRDTVVRMTGRSLGSDVYAVALNKMVINCADTSANARVIRELKADAQARKSDPDYQPPLAFSDIDGACIWIRQSELEKGDRVLAGIIVHEAAHLVGMPTHAFAEAIIGRVHVAAGLPR